MNKNDEPIGDNTITLTSDTLIGGLFVIALFWVAVICLPEDWRGRFQAAGDALGSVGVVAGALATYYAVRAVALQRSALNVQAKQLIEDHHLQAKAKVREEYAGLSTPLVELVIAFRQSR